MHEPHWSTTVATDLLAHFAHNVSPETNAQVANLFTQLGEALDAGHTVVELSHEQLAFFTTQPHPLVAFLNADNQVTTTGSQALGSQKPVVIQHKLAYFHRQWWQENTLAAKIQALVAHPVDAPASVDLSHLPDWIHERQRDAVVKALDSRFTLITGGPGTGKTWTVAQLVLTLLRARPDISIALAAPTGKAAQRMQEALDKSLTESATPELLALVKTQLDQAKTIHRLLGLGFNTAPRFHAQKPLPYDLIIIDEASMLGVALANQLMQAVGEQSSIILLGDANQLAAVDAGAVLADLCCSDALKTHHVNLTQSTRFTADSGVGQLATAVLENNVDAAHHVIQIHTDIQQINPKTNQVYTQLWQSFTDYAEQVKTLYAKPATAQQVQLGELFKVFDRYRILTATHAGKLGDTTINQQMEAQLQNHLGLAKASAKQPWFHGRPVMMLKNDYQLKLANGDIGIALLDDAGNYAVYFPSLARPLAANRLSENAISTAFSMTIHKSQGSEFSQVAMVLDAPKSDSEAHSLISRELIYTAITRAKQSVALYATDDTVDLAITTKAVRQTGLGQLLSSR